MAIHMDLERKVQHILKVRAKTGVNGVDFTLESDGVTPIIKYWDDVKLGTKPTVAELDALTSDPAYIAYQDAEDAKKARPTNALAELMNEPLLKTFLTENRAATLARGDTQKINMAVIGVKALLINAYNKHIEDMQA